MTLLAYPRLPTAVAADLLTHMTPLSLDKLAQMARTEHGQADWYPTAPNRVDRQQLSRLQTAVREVAKRYGHPGAVGGRSAKLIRFDQDVSVVLLDGLRIIPADAAHDGVWSFLSLVLLPDVAFWRFPNRDAKDDYDRLLGRPRNVFRRLWWRAYSMGQYASQHLQEDEAVAIMERASLGRNPKIARALAETHLKMVVKYPEVARSLIIREAGKRMRRLSVVVTLAALTEDELAELVLETFEHAVDAIKRSQTASVASANEPIANRDSGRADRRIPAPRALTPEDHSGAWSAG